MQQQSMFIYGIQQIGIGVADVAEAYRWYAHTLQFDLLIFDDQNEAVDMACYMGGAPQPKRAVLAMNKAGGGGLELWQYTQRTPQAAIESLQFGDLGLLYIVIGTDQIYRAFDYLKSENVQLRSEAPTEKDGSLVVFFEDPFGNLLCLKELSTKDGVVPSLFTGVIGVGIGLEDLEVDRKLYEEVLGFTHIEFEETGVNSAFAPLKGGGRKAHRLVLTNPNKSNGRFGTFLGNPSLELVQLSDEKGKHTFKDRQWGDLGFIHLCFDVFNLEEMSQRCAKAGYPFTVRSQPNFQMGETEADWAYLEDKSLNLIEFVQTHELPLLKRIGLKLDLRQRDPHKPLPWWVLKCLKLKRKGRISS